MRTLLVLALLAFAAGCAAIGATPSGPDDFVYENAVLGDTTFSHKGHLAAEGAACGDCHPKPFGMKKGGTTITMAGMNAGEACGTCHNGTKAFAASECARCHKAKTGT
jgi:c(7)-type cytochrome triheme protein